MSGKTQEPRAQKPGFSGYWRLVKHDNLDAFLKACCSESILSYKELGLSRCILTLEFDFGGALLSQLFKPLAARCTLNPSNSSRMYLLNEVMTAKESSVTIWTPCSHCGCLRMKVAAYRRVIAWALPSHYARMQEAGIPWVMRKVLVKSCSNSVDIIHHAGPAMRITTVNAKTSWSRTLQEGRVVTQVGSQLASRPPKAR